MGLVTESRAPSNLHDLDREPLPSLVAGHLDAIPVVREGLKRHGSMIVDQLNQRLPPAARMMLEMYGRAPRWPGRSRCGRPPPQAYVPRLAGECSSSTPQWERAWDTRIGERHRRLEIQQQQDCRKNPFRPC